LREQDAWHLIATSIDEIVIRKKMTKVMRPGFFGNGCQQRPSLGQVEPLLLSQSEARKKLSIRKRLGAASLSAIIYILCR